MEFVLIGGMAGTVHGCSLVTEDVDVCAPFTAENLQKLLRAIEGLSPKHRMSSQSQSLESDSAKLAQFHDLYLLTDAGQLDVLDCVDGVGPYDVVAQCSISIDMDGRCYRVLDIATLIKSKEALGRPKDLQVVMELKAIVARQSG